MAQQAAAVCKAKSVCLGISLIVFTVARRKSDRKGKLLKFRQRSANGLLEGAGYLLTGRHGSFSSYEAFIHVIDRQRSK
jgi:hypothetical protein